MSGDQARRWAQQPSGSWPVEWMPSWAQSLRSLACFKAHVVKFVFVGSIGSCGCWSPVHWVTDDILFATYWLQKIAEQYRHIDQKGSKIMLYFQVMKLRKRCGLSITAYFLHHREAVWSWWLLACFDICNSSVWHAGAGYWNWVHDGIAGSIFAAWRR